MRLDACDAGRATYHQQRLCWRGLKGGRWPRLGVRSTTHPIVSTTTNSASSFVGTYFTFIMDRRYPKPFQGVDKPSRSVKHARYFLVPNAHESEGIDEFWGN